MKVTYREMIETRTAFSRKMYCPSCGGHEYEIVRLDKMLSDDCIDTDQTQWVVRCAQCGCEGYESPTRDIAIARWKQL